MTLDEALHACREQIPVCVKKRKGHQPLSALIKLFTHDAAVGPAAVVVRSDGAIRTYLLKNIRPLQPQPEQDSHEVTSQS